MSVLQIFANYGGAMLSGLLVTLKLVAVIWTAGVIAGVLLGVSGARWPRAVGAPAKLASVIFSAIPILVFLFWLHYPLQTILGVVIDPFITAALALSIVNIVLVADICRDAIVDFPQHYVWAGQVCGLTRIEITRHIKLPLIARRVMPSVLTVQITMLQSTLFASLISVDEIFRVSQRINSQIYKPVEIYSMLAVFFIIVCVPLHLLAKFLKDKYTRDISER